jgi:hypothetical protein
MLGWIIGELLDMVLCSIPHINAQGLNLETVPCRACSLNESLTRTIVHDRAASGVAAHQNRLSTTNRTRAMLKNWTQVMYPTDHAQF